MNIQTLTELIEFRERRHKALIAQNKQHLLAENQAEIDKYTKLLSDAELVRERNEFNPRTYFKSMNSRKVDNRLQLDLDYLRRNFSYENGKLYAKRLGVICTWQGTTSINVTIDKVIYKASRIVYTLKTGEDIIDSDIGYKDGDYTNYSFDNLYKKG
jgi:hypothetical protein